jgi:hypothetical protein
MRIQDVMTHNPDAAPPSSGWDPYEIWAVHIRDPRQLTVRERDLAGTSDEAVPSNPLRSVGSWARARRAAVRLLQILTCRAPTGYYGP